MILDHWKFLKLFCTINILLLSPFTFSQKVIVKDSKTKEAIPYVYVLRSDTTKATTANKDGVVDLSGYIKKELIIFQHSAYEPLIGTKIKLIEDGVVFLVAKSNNLPSIEIKASLRNLGLQEDNPLPAEKIDLLEADKLNPMNMAQLIENTGSVSVQRSQGGGGSPVIRGFEANKILLVIDGVRMNNAIYRSGHLQNVITLDQGVLEAAEIHFGPSSVLYGSDAIGGVFHFHTKRPTFNPTSNLKKVLFTGSSNINYNTNGNGLNGHFDFNLGFDKFAMITSVSANKYGDIKMGKRRAHGDSTWGLWNNYVDQIDGQDTMLVNPDNLVQLGSGFIQYDILNKMAVKLGDKYELSSNFQYSNSTNINRNDVLDDYSGNNLKWAEWYYGPQQRIFGSLKLDIKSGSTLFHRASIIASYQNIDESRVNRRFQSSDRTTRKENVQVIGLNMDFVRELDSSKVFYYGLEASHNIVSSEAEMEDIYTGVISEASTRYPNGGSHYSSLGAYISYKQKFSHKLLFTAGLRYSHIIAESRINKDIYVDLPYDKIKFNKGAVSGNVGLFIRPNNGIDIKVSASSGFRAPNIDDYGKVFEKDGFVVVPNDHLKPEYALNGDIGIVKRFGWKKLVLEGSIFYTHLFDAIVRTDAELNGQDSLVYDGFLGKIQTNTNASQAFVTGFNVKFDWMIAKGLHVIGTFNYTRGFNLTDDAPLAHIPPMFGKLGLNYHWKNLDLGIYTIYNMVKPLKEYAPGTTDNLGEALAYTGTPGWGTLNITAGYKLFKKMTIQVGVYNILDHHYRQFASGISAPGVNFTAKLKYEF